MAWEVWNAFPAITETFLCLGTNPSEVTAHQLNKLERYIVLLYGRTNCMDKVDECRKHLFTKKGRAYDSIPPTQSALLQHIRRAIYQGGFV